MSCSSPLMAPVGGAQAAALASLLRRWAHAHPRPYVGHHWPS
jgi:hypothetical protein